MPGWPLGTRREVNGGPVLLIPSEETQGDTQATFQEQIRAGKMLKTRKVDAMTGQRHRLCPGTTRCSEAPGKATWRKEAM